jgi:hypothetical protein
MAQSQPPQVPQRPVLQTISPSDIQVTGCIVQGSSPAVFLLENGKKDPKDKTEEGRKYFLSPAAPDLNLKAHLKHSVRITATEDFKVSAMPVREPVPPSTERPGEERTLPRLIIKSITMVSEKCS